MIGRSDSSQQSAAGWRSWPLVQSGDYGQVYVSSEGRFGYYDDEEAERVLFDVDKADFMRVYEVSERWQRCLDEIGIVEIEMSFR